MSSSKNIEKLDKSNVRLTVKVSAEDTKSTYDSLIKEYAAKAQIKGFRPGKVPPSVLEAKFGESLRMEAAQKLIEDELKVIFDEIEEKPLAYAQPQLEDEAIDLKPGEDFEFKVIYDVFPEVKVETYSGFTVEEAQVSILKDDIEHELKHLQDQNAIVTDSDGPVAKGDILTMNFAELDADGKAIASSAREDFTCTVGEENNYYAFDKELIGLEKGKESTFKKSYKEDFANPELAGKTLKFQVLVSRIRRKDLPAIDDELAQDIDEKYKTLDDLKKDIKERLTKSAASRIRQKKLVSLMDQIIEKNPLVLPESMINANLYSKYEQMVRQFGGKEEIVHQLLQAQGTSIQNLFEQWKPSAEKELYSELIINEIIKLENIDVSDEELDAELKTQAENSKTSYEETKEYFEKNNAMDYLKSSVKERKAYDLLLEKNTSKKGEKIKYLDLMNENS